MAGVEGVRAAHGPSLRSVRSAPAFRGFGGGSALVPGAPPTADATPCPRGGLNKVGDRPARIGTNAE